MSSENKTEFNNTDLLINLYEMLFNDIITVETSKIISKFIMDLIDNTEIDEEKVINYFNEKNPENIEFNLKEDLRIIYDICLEIYEEEQLKTIFPNMIKKSILSLKQAAEEMGMTVSQFKTAIKNLTIE